MRIGTARLLFPSAGSLLFPLLPGLLLAGTVALAARFLGSVTPLPPVLFALLLGMAFAGLGADARHQAGLDFAARPMLRVGVALLGVQISFSDFAALGVATVAVTFASLALTLLVGLKIGRMLGLSSGSATVSASAVAICGASAALAVAAALPKGRVSDQEVARTVAGITVAGTVAMLGLPALALWLGLDDPAAGLLLGASIHEVAQAIAAGFSLSDPVGEAATIVKLLRVACLGGVVLALGLVWNKGAAPGAVRSPLLPGFLIIFVLLAGLTSLNMIPAALQLIASEVSRWCLLAAIAALGLRVSFSRLISGGGATMAAIAINSGLLILFVLAGLWLTGR